MPGIGKPDQKRVTQSDIARTARVSQVAVSLALRGHPSIPEATRRHIRAIADRLGYIPDPSLSVLNAYRNSVRPPAYRSTLALLTNHETREGWKGLASASQYFDAACLRAEELGYKVEPFWLREPGMTHQNASRILMARGIQGIINAPQRRARAHLNLDWSRFSVISLGYTMTRPAFHAVANHHFRSMVILCRRLRALGYRRPGLAIMGALDERVDGNWSGAFLSEQRKSCTGKGVPLLIPAVPEDWNFSAFAKWFRKHRPDCIVTIHQDVFVFLKELGVSVPSDVGVAMCNVTNPSSNSSGIDENSALIGRAAVDLVVSMINRNELGIPAVPQRLLVEGTWRPGATVQRITAGLRRGISL